MTTIYELLYSIWETLLPQFVYLDFLTIITAFSLTAFIIWLVLWGTTFFTKKPSKLFAVVYMTIIIGYTASFFLPNIITTGNNDNDELKGFSVRDIQYLESIGFIDNLDGSFTITLTGLTPSVVGYTFEYMPYNSDYGNIMMITVLGNNSLRLQLQGGFRQDKVGGTLTLWGGDVS